MGDVILSPGPMPGHTRSQSGSGLLEGDSVSGRRSVRTNSHLYQVYEQPDHPRPLCKYKIILIIQSTLLYNTSVNRVTWPRTEPYE